MVAKRRRPRKIQQSDFVVKPVLNVNMATDENQASMGHITTLDILSRDTTGAVEARARRVGCQQVDHFVGALWICSKFSDVGTGAEIRLCAIVLEIG